jgi:outer membrane protein insertion porin family
LKAYFYYTFTIVILFTLIVSCRSTKKLSPSQALITKLKLKGFDSQFEEQAKAYVALDIRPNSPFNLFIYNTFSKKGKLKLGEAPHLVDSALIEVSRKQIKKFLNTKGFLNATVNYTLNVKNKRAKLVYIAQKGPAFRFNNISFTIKDSTIKSLYLSNRARFTQITKGARYDEDSIAVEREKIYFLMKSNGYYDFLRQYVRPVVDTNTNNSLANIDISITNPSDGSKHKQYSINDTYINIQSASIQQKKTDTTVIKSDYYFYDRSAYFKAKRLANFIYFKKQDNYSIEKAELTNQRLYDLNVFKSVTISFKKTRDSTNRLNATLDIVPLKRKFNRIDAEYTFNSSITGLNLGLTYQNRNAFGGGEVFEIKGRSGFQFDKNLTGKFIDRVLTRDYQIGTSISFPRLISPFRIPLIGKNGIPHTRIGLSYQIFNLTNTYQRNTLSSTFTYEWIETKFKSHSFTPINIQYSQGKIKQSIADSLEAQGERFFLTTLRSQLVSSSLYSYTYNFLKLNEYRNFCFFLGNIEIGGNSAALIAKTLGVKSDANGQKRLFGVPYYEFVKLEADFRYYHSLGGERQLVMRLNSGIGIAYGNVQALPFEKLFFAGGSTGIRAWQARTLGPGNYNRSSLKNDTARINLRNLDQLGDLKIEGNFEYRFKLLQNFFGTKVKGATFIDYGNIWQIRNEGLQQSREFRISKLWEQMAVGVGLGVRFDVSFFVFRLDAGIKLKDPQFVGNNQWVCKYWFDKQLRNEFKNNYNNVTNTPDSYTFTQIQFGIGMPF